MEDLAYRRLLDLYYDTEAPIPTAIPLVSRRLRLDSDVIELVLKEFFELTENGWINRRADQEIAGYHAYLARQKANGSLGGRPKKTHRKPTANPSQTQTEPKKTLTNNHEPITINQIEDSGAAQARTPPPPSFLGDENIKDIHPKAIVPIDRDWELPEQWGMDAEALGWKPAEILKEAEKFRQHWYAGKGAGTRRGVKGWRSSWSNWLANAEKFKR
jgi:uncharacterized protein YdaU (DUF1376 family)